MLFIQTLFINRNVLRQCYPYSNGTHSITTSLEHFKRQKLAFPQSSQFEFQVFSSLSLFFFSDKKNFPGTILTLIFIFSEKIREKCH